VDDKYKGDQVMDTKTLINRVKQISKVRAMVLNDMAPEINRRVLEALEADFSRKLIRGR